MAAQPGAGDQIGAYEVLTEIARGGMATVFEVRDTRDDRHVAMKVMHAMANQDEARVRFRREFRALSRLNHPNVLKVHEFGLHAGRPWFTMERIEGRLLKEEVTHILTLPPEERFARVEALLCQIAGALAYIHDGGLVHRDVTPANIMVTPDGDAKLMDFGVVSEIGRQELTAVGEVIGTAAYISPEQIESDAIDARADLYTLGCVLYLMLTGRKAFNAHTLQGYLDKHLNHDPVPPRQIDPLVPEHLDTICMRLVQKRPADRYASAVHLLAVLGVDPGESSHRWPPRTVGHNQLRRDIRGAIEEAVRGREGTALLVCGRRGQGKSRLLHLAEDHARRNGLPVAFGACRAHDRPFGPFISVFDALKGDNPPAILSEVFGGDDPEHVWERYAILSAFRQLVVDRAPCLVLLDDVHRADPATVELINYLVRNTLELADEPVCFVLTQDSVADTPASRVLMRTGRVERHELQPLDATEVEALVLSVVEHSDAALALGQRLHGESSGSPAFIADMLRGMIDEELLVPGERPGFYQLTLDAAEITRSKLPMPPSMRQALRDRLSPLGTEAREVGRILAVARRELPLDVVIGASPYSEDRTMMAIEDLEDAMVVRAPKHADDEMVGLAQSRFREVLLEDVEDSELQRRHRRMAEVLERYHRTRPGAVVTELAHHFEAAGVAPKAYAFLIAAAHRNLQRSLYDETLALLDRALALEPTARSMMLLDEADERLADVYLARSQARHHLGQWAEAIADARQADTLAANLDNAHLQSRTAGELGGQLATAGSEDAEPHLRRALQKAKDAGDISLFAMPTYRLAGIVWSRGDLESAARLWRECLDKAVAANDERAQGWGYNGLAIYGICVGKPMEARKHLERSAQLFERQGMLGPLATIRVNLVEVYLNLGILQKALALADRTVEAAREVQHPQGIALGLAWRAEVLRAIGRYDDALLNGTEATRIARSLGDAPEDELIAIASTVPALIAMGQPDKALHSLVRLEALLPDHDYEGIGPLVRAWHAQAVADTGDLAGGAELLVHDRPPSEWAHVQVRTDLAWASAYVRVGRIQQALPLFQSALTRAEASGYRLYQLTAHEQLGHLHPDETVRARHLRVAAALARSLAANLSRSDSQRFLEIHTRT